ncbi:MAG TPA: phytanoyl-CoA dioxygenase family protein [Bacteroidia bacterium]|nr:phytanoyl-CoA dioxygenase family protein [Bacteroidia bacterium]
MAEPVFRDPNLQQRFDADGYVLLKQFLDKDKVERLKQAYFDLLPESGGAMTGDETDFKSQSEITYDFTFIDRNWEYKQKVFDVIQAAFEQHYEPVLADYTPIIANFIRKGEDGGEVPLHQNWAFADEIKYSTVSIWVPLVDSTRANGTLEITPGSHKRFGQFRGPMVPWECEKIKDEIIRDYMVPMEAEAGDCVILDDSVVHYSNINRTDGLRLTIQLILVPKATTSIHYHLDRAQSPDEVRILEVDRDFYMKFHPWKRPEGKEIGTQKIELRYIDLAEWDARLKGPEFGDPNYAAFMRELRAAQAAAASLQAPEPVVAVQANTAVAAPNEQGFFSRIKKIFS